MNKQHDNEDDRLSMFAHNSSTITTSTDQVFYARENINTYEKASCSELHEGKTKIIKLGKAIKKNITQATLSVNFTIMKEGENEAYLGDIRGNTVSENDTLTKHLSEQKNQEKHG